LANSLFQITKRPPKVAQQYKAVQDEVRVGLKRVGDRTVKAYQAVVKNWERKPGFKAEIGSGGKQLYVRIKVTGSRRNIENWKERLITILVTPFTTCSARLPVYAILIALVIPQGSFLGLNYQGLMLMFLYLVGFAMALLSAWILSKTLKIQSKSYFVVEMPNYKIPLLKNTTVCLLSCTPGY